MSSPVHMVYNMNCNCRNPSLVELKIYHRLKFAYFSLYQVLFKLFHIVCSPVYMVYNMNCNCRNPSLVELKNISQTEICLFFFVSGPVIILTFVWIEIHVAKI